MMKLVGRVLGPALGPVLGPNPTSLLHPDIYTLTAVCHPTLIVQPLQFCPLQRVLGQSCCGRILLCQAKVPIIDSAKPLQNIQDTTHQKRFSNLSKVKLKRSLRKMINLFLKKSVADHLRKSPNRKNW